MFEKLKNLFKKNKYNNCEGCKSNKPNKCPKCSLKEEVKDEVGNKK